MAEFERIDREEALHEVSDSIHEDENRGRETT
jgi:hypothetical protein